MKQVVIVVPEGGVSISSMASSLEILGVANEYWKAMGNKAAIGLCLASSSRKTLGDGFFSIHARPVGEIEKADLLIIPPIYSNDYSPVIEANKELIAWIRARYKDGAEIASICSGSFLLAATGLLDKKSCVAHWQMEPDFRKLFPGVDLQLDQLIVAEQGIYTNGGAFSFLNLLLVLVEKYFDRRTAIYCSKLFQIDMERTSQAPYRIFEARKDHGDELVSRAQAYIEAHPGEKISFATLAGTLSVSRRNFDRRFIKATGYTPVEYLQRARIELAKNALEMGRKSIAEIMSEVGYSDEKAFREVFRKISGLSPVDYQARYHSPVPGLWQ